ncbi:winged helix-turn-helix transcriptional regulator [Halospeciosus flavus]|uniref:Winged helix-turn-helix transcriptional regulator n=1 Tax=Halospeciosus flavus TaxID=3032283 RepID=A0ABD5Z6J6_9EURY|nr:helix-turn-helix domain-containing protein [Halospeciosus flavus]
MSETRSRISRYVRTHPGVHFNELVRELDLATGQVQYHLKQLRAADELLAESLYGQTHYYPPGYDEWERGALALLRRETSRDVLFALLEGGPERPQQVAEDLNIARSTLEWHLDRLVERDLVEKRRDERNRVTLALTRPAETATLLDVISPSLPERMVDRFERLVDSLLSS